MDERLYTVRYDPFTGCDHVMCRVCRMEYHYTARAEDSCLTMLEQEAAGEGMTVREYVDFMDFGG